MQTMTQSSRPSWPTPPPLRLHSEVMACLSEEAGCYPARLERPMGDKVRSASALDITRQANTSALSDRQCRPHRESGIPMTRGIYTEYIIKGSFQGLSLAGSERSRKTISARNFFHLLLASTHEI
jgi:hypothetical protein